MAATKSAQADSAQAEWEDGYWWSNDGLRLHFRDYAGPDDRPPVICMPGLTRNARDFEAVAARLAGDWRVICVEQRGRGESAYAKDPMTYNPLTYVQDMEALLAQEKIEQFISIGTSLGGLMTMLLASMRPGRVVGALLNDVGPDISPEGLERIREYVGQGRSFPTWMHAARWLSELQGPVFPDFELDDWLVMAKRTMKLSGSGRIVLDYDMKIAEPFQVPGGEAGVDLWPTLAALAQTPTLVVRGETSDIFAPETADKMLTVLKRGRLVTVPNRGHAPTLEEPEVEHAIDALLQDALAVSEAEAPHSIDS
ncbi:alpha/beta fold hydrolase [Alterisphingorhabdus coralli]|uniref:Alpha/beta hydrolase n=1 Tax=Alterisphingorhabdus coralli TaxID=3071408 RepID=A0AA97F868_9SPHN|nr:alpha/beta hydrolase [Parasphingorhabdus sp. SCSIO 66989]WOE75956.1 alpha/beta hydrolase [Parasphingorhabdus sp. SCSIO 66989]